MKIDPRDFLPNRISGQIALIIAASLFAIHALLMVTFVLIRPDRRPPPDQLVTLIHLIGASPATARGPLATTIAAAFPHLELVFAGPADGGESVLKETFANDRLLDGLRRHLGSDYRLARVESRSTNLPSHIAIRLPEGGVITAREPDMVPPRLIGGPLEFTILMLATSVTLLGLWAARGLTGPLRHFAKAAEKFGPETDVAPLPERGPFEIRAAARALNQMRERIKTLIDGRTRMLTAISHDLRTPITRMRLRCEFIADLNTRNQIVGELLHMNTMVESVLTFLRDGQSREQMGMVDISTSLQTICDQFTDMGRNVRFYGPDHLVVRARADELHRAITNLIDNAVRYGDTVDVRLDIDAHGVSIAIEDNGPGITADDRVDMLEPFVRGDPARGVNSNTGFGLGLSIARNIIEAHGGTLTLADRSPSGLIARVALPQATGEQSVGALPRPEATARQPSWH
jgi:signal transduction histidine kinase